MRSQHNMLMALLICCLLLICIFFIRKRGVDNIRKDLILCIKKVLQSGTSLEKLRGKSMEALNVYFEDHKKMTEELKDDRKLKLHISYELNELEDMYAWFKLASNNSEPLVQNFLLSDKKCTKYLVQDNGTDNTGAFYVILEVFDRTNNSGQIGVLTYINMEWDPSENQYVISKVVIDLYEPNSNYFRDY